MAPENAINAVMLNSNVLRLRPPASVEMERLVSTANTPEIAIPCPTSPSLTPRSPDMGVSRLTGINSEAMSAKTHNVMAKTPLQYARSL
ncbi:hypothetical protein D3C80_1938360 [compost metagenome]